MGSGKPPAKHLQSRSSGTEPAAWTLGALPHSFRSNRGHVFIISKACFSERSPPWPGVSYIQHTTTPGVACHGSAVWALCPRVAAGTDAVGGLLSSQVPFQFTSFYHNL